MVIDRWIWIQDSGQDNLNFRFVNCPRLKIPGSFKLGQFCQKAKGLGWDILRLFQIQIFNEVWGALSAKGHNLVYLPTSSFTEIARANFLNVCLWVYECLQWLQTISKNAIPRICEHSKRNCPCYRERRENVSVFRYLCHQAFVAIFGDPRGHTLRVFNCHQYTSVVKRAGPPFAPHTLSLHCSIHTLCLSLRPFSVQAKIFRGTPNFGADSYMGLCMYILMLDHALRTLIMLLVIQVVQTRVNQHQSYSEENHHV